jgi:MoaA/NifB/PqqE/SkfB family radical SAM enzyme
MLITNPLEIELTTKCTLGCPACPRNDTEEKKENWDVGHMNTDIAKSLANSTVERRSNISSRLYRHYKILCR